LTAVQAVLSLDMVDFETAVCQESRAAELWSEDDALFIRIRYGTEMTLDDVEEMGEITKEIWDDKKVRILSDMRGLKSITREARKFTSRNNSKLKDNVTASAILIGNPISTMIGNLIMRINQPPFPTQLFTDVDDAKQWLSDFKT